MVSPLLRMKLGRVVHIGVVPVRAASMSAFLLVMIVVSRLGVAVADGASAPNNALFGDISSARPLQRNFTGYTSHAEIVINRPSVAIWPYIVNNNEWTRLKLRHASGPRGELGEIFAIVNPLQPEVIMSWAENIEFEPNRRRTFKVYGQDGNLRGFVHWKLQEAGDRTVVSYDIYYESAMSVEEAQRSDAASRSARQDSAKTQSASELSALKQLVESL